MKISKETFAILRNFSSINQSILFKPGKLIRTAVSGDIKDFYASAEVTEEFPVECAIYDLKRLRDCASLFNDPDFEFGEKFLNISDDKNNFRYTYCDPHIIDAPDYNKNIVIKNPMASFELKYEQIKMAIDASSILGLHDILISSTGGVVSMTAFDDQNKSSDTFKVVIAEGIECPDFTSKYSLEKMRRLIDADYIVTISKQVLTEFKSPLVTYHTGGEIKIIGAE
jgi:hypothetical protein